MMRIGEMLVSAGLLSSDQVDEILRKQQSHPEPFGLLAQRMFGTDTKDIERIWTETTSRMNETTRPEPQEIDDSVIDLLTRRQAWQFRFLPMRIDEAGTLVAATTRSQLSRAVRFATRVLDRPCSFVLTDSEFLAANLEAYYALPGLDRRVIEGEPLQSALQVGEDAA